MRYSERQNFTYDPQIGTAKDTSIALKMFHEYVCRLSPRPFPTFFEVDRSPAAENVDPMWGTPRSARTLFTRELTIPAINQFQSQTFRVWWNRVTTRGDRFWTSNLALQQADYFPVQGDLVYWNGYRVTIINVSIPPECYWGQTGVWTGLVVDCFLPPYGDAVPPANLSTVAVAERSAGWQQPLAPIPQI